MDSNKINNYNEMERHNNEMERFKNEMNIKKIMDDINNEIKNKTSELIHDKNSINTFDKDIEKKLGTEFFKGENSNTTSQLYDASGQLYDASGQLYDASGQSYDASGQSYDASGQLYDASGQLYDSSGQLYDSSGQLYDSSGQLYDSSGQLYDSSGQSYDATLQPDEANTLVGIITIQAKLINHYNKYKVTYITIIILLLLFILILILSPSDNAPTMSESTGYQLTMTPVMMHPK